MKSIKEVHKNYIQVGIVEVDELEVLANDLKEMNIEHHFSPVVKTPVTIIPKTTFENINASTFNLLIADKDYDKYRYHFEQPDHEELVFNDDAVKAIKAQVRNIIRLIVVLLLIVLSLIAVGNMW